jgi:hypothetical protein
LDNLPDHLKNDDSVKKSIKNITDILKNNELKDFTAGMIRNDLDVINNAFQFQTGIENPLYEGTPRNPLYRGKSKELNPAKSVASDAVASASLTMKKIVLPDGAEESFDSKANKERIQESDSDLSSMLKLNVLPDPVSLSRLANMQKLNALPNLEPIISKVKNTDTQQADSPPPNLVASIDVAEVVLHNLDPVINGKPSEETNSSLEDDEIPDGDDALSEVGSGLDSDDEDGAVSSSESELPANETSSDPAVDVSLVEEPSSKLAESAPTINTTPAPIGKAIEQGTDAAKATTERTPSPAPFGSSSTTADIKDSAKANPYLESLKTEWDPADDGYHTITKPFFITGGVPTSSMIAEAYLIPAGKKLNFTEEVDVFNSGLDGGVVQAKHILHKHRDTDTQRDTRPYLKLSAKAPNSILVGASKVAKNETMKQQMVDRFKADLKNTYLESFKKINEEHKKINSGKQLETLVIVPLSSLPLILSEVESEVLASAVISIQNEIQDLKIHISAAETLHENRIRSAYEKILKEST